MSYQFIYNHLTSLDETCNEHQLRRYINLVTTFKERNSKKVLGFHRHHMIPISLGGINRKANIVIVTAREHFILHRLLWKAVPYKNKMMYAFWRMLNGKNSDYKFTSREYEKVLTEYAASQSIKMKGKGNHFFGKTHSEETRKIISEKGRGRIQSEETKQKMNEIRSNRIYVHNEEENRYIKEDQLESFLANGYVLGKLKGRRVQVNDGIIERRIFKDELDYFISLGFTLGRLSTTKLKITKTNTGKHPTQESIEKRRKAMKGIKWSEETNEKRRQSMTGKTHSDNTKNKISETLTGLSYTRCSCIHCKKEVSINNLNSHLKTH